ncbi:hypothetical protein BH11ARM2_BH11ARM2_39010 [soil metagenome]
MILLATMLALQVAPLLSNGNFENGLTGWKVEGKASVEGGKLHLGSGKAAVRQRYEVPGLRMLFFGATLKPDAPTTKGRVRLQCFDEHGRLLLDRDGAPDPKKGTAGIYLKTQAHTAYVVLSIEKEAAGTLVADDAGLKDDDRDRVEHAPQVDLDAYMRPIWEGDTVIDETVLLAEGSGRLLFRPTKILSVRDSALKKEYREGTDFTLGGNVLSPVAGSDILKMDESQFVKGEFPWTDLAGHHVKVTYTHEGAWNGPLPRPQGNLLPNTLAKLKAKKPLTIVAYGDSITLGINVSGFLNVPPYMPPWPSLVARQLGKRYGDDRIQLYNTALGGMTANWAKENAKDLVAALDPDLVIVAFGMNDFWSYTPPQFAEQIQGTLKAIRTRRPRVEFLLVASMKFDPAYTKDPTYVGNLAGYAAELHKMAGPGVAVFDMTALSDALYRAKSQKDLATDPMHPDDFFARWYAQGVVATLEKP